LVNVPVVNIIPFSAQPIIAFLKSPTWGLLAVGGLQGIAAEAIQQIHQQQLLVLLLVLQAQLHQLQLGGALIQLIQQGQHGPIFKDMTLGSSFSFNTFKFRKNLVSKSVC